MHFSRKKLRRFAFLLFFLMEGVISLAVAKDQTFVTALTGKFPPFSYYNQEGNLTGFDVDVSREIAARLDLESDIRTTEWDGILAGLLQEKYDAIVSSMAITPERQKQVSFSIPYYNSGAQLFVHRDNPDKIYSIDECINKRIGVVLGETYQQYIEQAYPQIEVVTFKSTIEIFEMLDQKRISGFVTDRLVGSWQIKQAKRNFAPVGDMLYKEKIGIPVRKSEKILLKKINSALADMKNDGTLDALYQKYFGLNNARVVSKGEMPLRVRIHKLLHGFGITLTVGVTSILIGFVFSIPVGLLLIDRKGLLRIPCWIARVFVDFIRGTPVLIQLLFVWLGLGISPFPAAILTLGVCTMAYMAEAVRSGLISVPQGQNTAAKALGLNSFEQFRYVIWPQAFRISLPTLMNSVVALIKDTALISVISIPELIREAQSIISVTFEPEKYYMIVAVMFFAVTFPLMKLSNALERKIQLKGFKSD